MNMSDKPIHTDGLSTPQLLLPSLIELCNNFLSFLLEELRQISQSSANSNWNFSLCSIFDLSKTFF